MILSYKKINIILLFLAIVGFIDSVYLTVKHYLGEIPPCSATGCEFVLTSTYSSIFGIPIAIFGAFYYMSILISLIAYFDTKKDIFIKYISYISIGGFLISMYLVYLQLFVIDYICQYCMVSAFVCVFIFIFGMYNLYSFRKARLLNNFNI